MDAKVVIYCTFSQKAFRGVANKTVKLLEIGHATVSILYHTKKEHSR